MDRLQGFLLRRPNSLAERLGEKFVQQLMEGFWRGTPKQGGKGGVDDLGLGARPCGTELLLRIVLEAGPPHAQPWLGVGGRCQAERYYEEDEDGQEEPFRRHGAVSICWGRADRCAVIVMNLLDTRRDRGSAVTLVSLLASHDEGRRALFYRMRVVDVGPMHSVGGKTGICVERRSTGE